MSGRAFGFNPTVIEDCLMAMFESEPSDKAFAEAIAEVRHMFESEGEEEEDV